MIRVIRTRSMLQARQDFFARNRDRQPFSWIRLPQSAARPPQAKLRTDTQGHA
ncbi:hypothetical protein IGB42_03164 [Andreprevotia sp. IGB-42]|uniref:hypothetical protein n=1 Tax=Andreprevotia sp. IGB-42 TaxID=2497473 RepID=UPI001358CCB5|nr:hypothetical protein [Andreprevotia sp. IGB-42]KAF0812495.1 hypothetical protein IGB42_03164 [Andreprevotia sp. IGB-42]